MNKFSIDRKWISIMLTAALILGIAALAMQALGSSPASAQSGSGNPTEDESADADDGAEAADIPIVGSALDRATAAALGFIGGGLVTGTETGDEEGYYEVEITLPDGRQVDVHLDEAFNILGQEAD